MAARYGGFGRVSIDEDVVGESVQFASAREPCSDWLFGRRPEGPAAMVRSTSSSWSRSGSRSRRAGEWVRLRLSLASAPLALSSLCQKRHTGEVDESLKARLKLAEELHAAHVASQESEKKEKPDEEDD
jgi:hypothetical protein